MEIKYLNLLKDTKDDMLVNRPLSLTEIGVLENVFNNGNVFPTSLRELLFIAGKFCIVLDYSICEDQQEMQDYACELLDDGNLQINRPFYAIHFYSDGSQFLYVYLDENNDDPLVNVAYIPNSAGVEHFYSLNTRLSVLLNSRVTRLREGFLPY